MKKRMERSCFKALTDPFISVLDGHIPEIIPIVRHHQILAKTISTQNNLRKTRKMKILVRLDYSVKCSEAKVVFFLKMTQL